MEWKSVQVNSNLIKTSTGRAYLIKLPKSEFTFWHPAKLVRFQGKNDYLINISYTDSFEFNIFRTGSSMNKLDEHKISVEEFERYFHHE